MAPTLLVLAAGMGSRYGGLKQIDPVGPSGETVLDYAVFDAQRAGFGRVVFVIRKDFEELFREKIGARYAGKIAVDYVFQGIDALPAGFAVPGDRPLPAVSANTGSIALSPLLATTGREKPWGTGHAVWCARDAVRENFAVINADDFYGADSFAQLGRFLRSETVGGALCPDSGGYLSGHEAPPTAKPTFAMVGFRLANTLSEHGAVSRGVCVADAAGELKSITEQTGILASEVGAGEGKKYSGEELVSMNCWGFTPELFGTLDAQLREFLTARGGEAKAEFYLPAAVSEQIARGQASVRVLPTASAWFGVTYREDKPRVTAAIAALVAAGKYPARLF